MIQFLFHQGVMIVNDAEPRKKMTALQAIRKVFPFNRYQVGGYVAGIVLFYNSALYLNYLDDHRLPAIDDVKRYIEVKKDLSENLIGTTIDDFLKNSARYQAEKREQDSLAAIPAVQEGYRQLMKNQKTTRWYELGAIAAGFTLSLSSVWLFDQKRSYMRRFRKEPSTRT